MIAAGATLLHYRLVEQIGEGGMGTVWKATDTTLGRDVAIKVLPEAFASDPDRLARFEREARVLASLNHPNVAAIYGFHEIGPSAELPSGLRFLAMELVEGEDLSRRLSAGRLPVDEVLEIAGRICEALEAAHDAGVVHRDLKPANVVLSTDGRIKVLDFGLAKALTATPASGSGPGASLSPTMTSAGTQAGMILGTAAYMSPEQARGKPVDRRADIWALGCMLFEMLAGRSTFGGETVTDTLAAVVRAEPDWSALPPSTPSAVRRVLRRALEKDPSRRLRDAGDLRLELQDAAADAQADAGGPTQAVASATASRAAARRWTGLVWAVAGAAVGLVAAWFWIAPTAPPSDDIPVRFEVVGAAADATIDPSSLTLSPDGRRMAWVVIDGALRTIHLREIDSLQTRQLPDTEGASAPAFSPNGQSIAFYAGGKLRRLDLGERRAIDLCESTDGAGISWGRNGTIVFNQGWISALTRVDAAGGPCEPATRLDADYGEIGHWFPDLLPDSRHLLISRWRTALNDMTVAVADLDGGEIRDLLPRASFARFVPPDRLLFTRAGAIHVVAFDPDRLEVSGDPVLLLDGVEQTWSNGRSTWAVSDTGTLAYQPGGLWHTKRTIARVSRDGSVKPLDIAPGAYLSVAMPPDGKRLAITEFKSGNTNVLIHDLERGVSTPVPLEAMNTYPVWNPDGRELAFATALEGPWDIYRYTVGAAEPEMLIEGTPDQIPMAWSPDGRFVVWTESYAETRLMELDGDRTPRAILPNSRGISISPDSRWIAYDAPVSGRKEVLVRGFPDGTRDYPISTDGGESPLWSRDGRELLYRRGNVVLAASIAVDGDGIVAERPRVLYRVDTIPIDDRMEWSYDPKSDEAIVIMNGENEIDQDGFVVVLDWQAALATREE